MTDAIEPLDPRFAASLRPDCTIERLFTGCIWAEGPVWLPHERALVWSDIPNDRMLRWDAASGMVTAFRQPSSFANGNTLDRQGRLITCEHGGRRVVRAEPDGSLTALADRWQDKRLNSPNDVVVASDGAVWFTDPTYGIDSNHEGHKADSEIGANHVYRLDPASGTLDIVADDFIQPNGLAFSPDERRLYIVDTGSSHVENGPRHIRAFDVREGRRLVGGAVFVESAAGSFDGLRVDEHGHLWCGEGDGVHCYAPDGTLIGKLRLPERAANVAFGGADGRRLFITATTSLYAIELAVRGATHR